MRRFKTMKAGKPATENKVVYRRVNRKKIFGVFGLINFVTNRN